MIRVAEECSPQNRNANDGASDISPKAENTEEDQAARLRCITDGEEISNGGEEMSAPCVAPATDTCNATGEHPDIDMIEPSLSTPIKDGDRTTLPIRGAPDVNDTACFAEVGETGTLPDGGHMPQTEAAVGTQELVVFVGSAMALHLSTIRPSYMENFGMVERERCSIFTPDGRKSVNRPHSDQHGDGDSDQGVEEEWLDVLQNIVKENEASDCNRPRG